ncbi:zinc finger protein 514-like isoform X1 [Pleurodeles waltl]
METPDPGAVKREISENPLSKAQASVEFRDVTICFSQKEWLDLQEHEKEIYRKVITEIHRAFSVMGYAIVNPGIVFRIKAEEQQLGLNDSLDMCETRCSSVTLNNSFDKPRNSVRSQKECTFRGWDQDPPAEGGKQIASNRAPGTPLRPSITVRAQNVCDPILQDRREQPEEEGIQGTNNTSQSCPVFHPSLSLWIKEMEDPCENDEKDPGRQNIASPTTDAGSLTTKFEDRFARRSAEQLKEFESLLKTTRENVQLFSSGSFLHKPSQLRRTAAKLCADRQSAFSGCGAGFDVFAAPVVPRAVTHEEKPYKCKDCQKSFGKKSNLIIHQRTHTGEKPYKCAQCDKGFSHKSNLNQHQTTHTGERPFQCTFCEKRFSHKVSRNLHQRTHTGERPYKCSVCGKCFRRNSHLSQHIKTHSGEKQNVQKQGKSHGTCNSLQVSQAPLQDVSLDIMDVRLEMSPVDFERL